MKKFIELIKRIHQERFSVVINKVIADKIPVSLLSVAPIDQAIDITKNLRNRNLNVDNLITITPPPLQNSESFQITHLADADKIHPRPEFIFTVEDVSARVANRYISDCKIVSLNGPGRNSELAYEAFMNNLDKLQRVYELLTDEESRETFYGYWLGNISHKFGELKHVKVPHYILSGFMPKSGDVFIDVGVCDGGTSIKFKNLGCKVYGFEMDKKNFDISKPIADKHGFVVENFGLDCFNHEVRYNSYGAATSINPNGSETAQVKTLDSYVEANSLSSVDFIKLDVEGAELNILKGAATTIVRFKPIIAVSAYHRWDDFWTLTEFLKSLRPDYEFAMRQFPETREDIPTWFENNEDELYYSLGLEPNIKTWEEVVLFAR